MKHITQPESTLANAQKGHTVQVHYKGRLEDGTVFDSSEGKPPLEFTVGEGRVISGFENAVVGMEPGETRTIEIPPEKAYGEHRNDMVVEVGRDQIPGDVSPEKGQQLQLRQQTGEVIPVVVTDTSESTITIDANHPLAGRTLIFDIELVDVS